MAQQPGVSSQCGEDESNFDLTNTKLELDGFQCGFKL